MDDLRFEKIPGLENLLNSKDFDQLDAGEKAIVLKHMDEAEYQSLRMVSRESASLFAAEASHIQPDPESRDRKSVV